MSHSLNLGGKLVSLDGPLVMGILNVTPDSFYDGGRYFSEKEILERAKQITEEGGNIIDIGGYSSRPGADHITVEEEKKRVIPAIKSIKKEYPDSFISIDSFRSEVVNAASGEGAVIINDISGGDLDPDMFATVARLKLPYILMHMKGSPQTMVKEAKYDKLLEEVIDYFNLKVNKLRSIGAGDIILDPGFGFAKTADHNFELLGKLKSLGIFNLPIMVGVSRKSMIYKKLEIHPDESLNGTTVLNTVALMNGASILRVHDVKACVEAVKLYKFIYP